MGIPEEDKMSVWLRDYGSGSGNTRYDGQLGYVDTRAMLANPDGMVAIADALEIEHKQDYCTHAEKVITKLEYVHQPTSFTELDEVLTHQSQLAYTATDMFREHDYAVTKFVEFLREMAAKYKTADAESSIKVSDVQRELPTGIPSVPGAPVTTTSTQPVVAPNLGASPDPNLPPAETSQEIG